jgi:cytochrome c peroxidase
MESYLMRRLSLALLLCAAPVAASATPAKEAPWLPEAAALRLTQFMGNLTPMPWDDLAAAWQAPVAAAATTEVPLSRLAESDAKAIREALAAQDRQALFAATTRAIARDVLFELDNASAALLTKGAKPDLLEAQALYRAFEDGIKAADPAAARSLGLAWLELMNSTGSAGVLGAGQVAVEEAQFNAARDVIATYIRDNYDPASFAPRDRLSPVPESVYLTGAEVTVPTTLPPGSNFLAQQPMPRLVLQFEEAGGDEADLPLVAFGDMLFDSPEIFGGPARDLRMSCSACHNRSDVNRDFFIPGITTHAGGLDVDSSFFNPMFDDRKMDPVDIPSLRGIRFTGPYGRDGREASLRDFTRNVIVKEFAGEEPTPFVLDALIAYMREFDFLPNSKLNRDGSLSDLASEAAVRGEVLFNQSFAGLDGQSCATCHTPSNKFRDGRLYDIGSANPPFPGGTATLFETPTLLNVNYTAPYFNDGALPTLASVVDWFDDTKSLGLSAEQRSDLTAYVTAVGYGDEPWQQFDDRNTPFRLNYEELTTFASTMDTFLPMKDQFNIALLVDTVAPDLAADASLMSNQSAKPDVYQLAGLLRAAGDAAAAGDWAVANDYWQAFKTLQSDIDARMY